MKKYPFLIPISIAIGLFMGLACNDDDNPDPCLKDFGVVKSETRVVNSFHSIQLVGIGEIFLTQGPEQSLRIETHDKILDLLETTVSDELLTITLDGCIEGQIDRLDVYITIPDIELIRLEGVGNINGQNDFDLDKLEIQIEGVGNISLKGIVDVLDIHNEGLGNVRAFDLISRICNIEINGSGNIEVHATEELNVTITGAGSVFYKGDPEISTVITGTGSVQDAN